MKRFLVIAFVSLFAVSAFAADFRFAGNYELEGRYIQNAEQDADGDSSAFYKHLIRLWVYASVDPKLDVSVRFTPVDGTMGNGKKTGFLDRGWATYKPFDGLKIEAGRYSGGNYAVNGFGGGAFYLKSGNVYGKGNGAMTGIRTTYTISDSASVFFAIDKITENQTKPYVPASSNIDDDAYVLGANIKMGDLGIFPRVAYVHLSNAAGTPIKAGVQQSVMAGYVGVTYLPATGFNLQAAGVFVTATSDDKAKEESLFGAMVDASFVMDSAYVGAILAYGSQDEDSKTSMGFGGDWDKTALIDTWFNGASDEDGASVGGYMAFYLYGGVDLTDTLGLKAVAAYYAQSDDVASQLTQDQHGLLDETAAMEFDLSLNYAWTDATNITLGAAYANITDISAKDDADPIYQIWWAAKTAF